MYYYNNGWQLVGTVDFDVSNHFQLIFTQNQIEILVNNVLVYSLAGSFGPKSYLAFRDYGLCFGPVVNYISNLNITPLNLEDGQFTGKKYDSGTGLVYFGARFYDPEVGRFISPDTYTNLPNDERILSKGLFGYDNNTILMNGISNPQLQNRYSYCGNNPINRTDPDGRFFGFDDVATCGLDDVAALGIAAIAAGLGYQPAKDALTELGKTIDDAISNMSAEHTKNASKARWDKHSKPRPGRETEKKKQKPDWDPRNPKKKGVIVPPTNTDDSENNDSNDGTDTSNSNTGKDSGNNNDTDGNKGDKGNNDNNGNNAGEC